MFADAFLWSTFLQLCFCSFCTVSNLHNSHSEETSTSDCFVTPVVWQYIHVALESPIHHVCSIKSSFKACGLHKSNKKSAVTSRLGLKIYCGTIGFLWLLILKGITWLGFFFFMAGLFLEKLGWLVKKSCAILKNKISDHEASKDHLCTAQSRWYEHYVFILFYLSSHVFINLCL